MSNDLFREIVGRQGDGDPETLADAVCADLALTVRQREAMFRLILAEIESMHRSVVRAVEHEVGRVGVKVDRAGTRRKLLDETFATGDGRRPKWGEATVADHKQRIALLDQMRRGLQLAIERHQAAIDAITAAGVTCLNDIVDIPNSGQVAA
jgi:hypothetical protein